jgi:hypothetical protein
VAFLEKRNIGTGNELMSAHAATGHDSPAADRRGTQIARYFGQAVFLFVALLSGQIVRGGVIAEVLYDGTLQETTPDLYTPTWLAFGGLPSNQVYDSANDATRLNTTSFAGLMGGYANHSPTGQLVNAGFPELNRQLGYTIVFSLRMVSESHSSSARAGFSVIAVSSDAASGVASSIEIGFQSGRVFAQSDDFGLTVADENTSFNPVGSDFINYALTVQGSSYELAADSNVILSGVLHDHFDHNINWPVSPYQIPNFLFLGDDTTSASAEILLRRVEVEATTVPEPPTWLLFGVGVLALCAWRRSRAI